MVRGTTLALMHRCILPQWLVHVSLQRFAGPPFKGCTTIWWEAERLKYACEARTYHAGALLDSFDICEWAEDHTTNPGASKLFPQDKLSEIRK